MGNALAFDTYAYVRKLREAGLTEQQAAVHAESLVNLIEERLTTKTDLARVEAGLKEDLARVEAGLKMDIVKVEAGLKLEIAKVEVKIETAKVDLIKWVVATGIVILGGMAAINRFIPPSQVVPYGLVRMETQEGRPEPPWTQQPVQSTPPQAKPLKEW